MKRKISQRFIILGIIASLIIIIFITRTLNSYGEKVKKAEYINQFEEKKELVKVQIQNSKEDLKKIDDFIQSHLPEEIYYHYHAPHKTDVEEDVLIVSLLEESLKEENVDEWLSVFSFDATRKLINTLNGKELNEREEELLEYLKRMSRYGKLESLSSFKEKGRQYTLNFIYSDGIEVEMPLEFETIQTSDGTEMYINNDVLKMIEKIERGQSN